MLYPTIRPLATLALKTYFRKIYLSGVENIPKNEAVILACTHPTAFVEPCILACFLDRPLYFLVRGDFFIKPFIDQILRNLHMLPIYRGKDGSYAKRKTNFSTLESCFEALKQKKTMLIMAEGGARHEKRLLPLQKGTARIALGTLQRATDLEVYIVPVGVNYTYDDRFRSEVMIGCAEPFKASDYLDTYEQDPRKAMKDLNGELERRLKEQMIIIQHPEDDELTDYLLRIYRAQERWSFYPIVLKNKDRLELERSIANTVNALSAEEKASLLKDCKTYFQSLENEDLHESTLNRKENFPWYKEVLLFLGGIPFLMGYLWNYPPLRFAAYVASFAGHITFYSSLKASVGMGAYILYFTIWLLIGYSIGGFLGLSLVFLMPFLGHFALWYREVFAIWKQKKRIKNLKTSVLKSIVQLRDKIETTFGEKRKSLFQ